LLHLIEPERQLPMGQLASTLACDKSNVTGLVDRLESRGLVSRRPSVEDRRVKVLVLPPGRARIRPLLLERITTPPAARAPRPLPPPSSGSLRASSACSCRSSAASSRRSRRARELRQSADT